MENAQNENLGSSRGYAMAVSNAHDRAILRLLVKVMLSDDSEMAIDPFWLKAIEGGATVRMIAVALAEGMGDDELNAKCRLMQKFLRVGIADEYIANYLGLNA